MCYAVIVKLHQLIYLYLPSSYDCHPFLSLLVVLLTFSISNYFLCFKEMPLICY